MVSLSLKNAKCYDSNDCCTGLTCVRARRLKDKFSKKLDLNCRRRDLNGNKKYSGCCKEKGSYSPFSFKKYTLPKKKMSKEAFKFIQNKDTDNINFLYPSEGERKALRERKAQLCYGHQSLSPTSVRSPSPSPTKTRTRSPSPTPTRRSPTRPDQALSKINPNISTKEELFRQISLNNALVLHLNGNGERNRISGRLTLENEDNKFEKCGNILGENKGCIAPKYSICAKARRRFQNSLKKKYGKYPKFKNCLTPPKESGEIKIHRNRGCCISKKKYGLGIQFKRLKK